MSLVVVRGIAFTFAIPPWQHPDEPTHFEHARLIAELRALPEQTDFSLPMRWEIADSMLRHDFWRGIEQPELNDAALSTIGTSPIGIYTLAQPRLYYILAAAWLTPWLGLPVEGQLYAVRLLAVVLNLVVVVSAYFSARRLFPAAPFLAIGVAAFVVFHPGHTDIMSAVNNDALVNALAAVWFLVLAWLYTRRWTWLGGLAGIALALIVLAAALLTKTTAIALAIGAPFAVVFFLLRNLGAKALGILLALGLAVTAVIAAAAWLAGDQLVPQLQAVADGLGRYFRVNLAATLNTLLAGTGQADLRLVVDVVFKSFWADFGWRHVHVAPWMHWVELFACLGAAAGGLVSLARAARSAAPGTSPRAEPPARGSLAFLAFGGLTALASAAITVFRSQAEQGLSRPYHSHGRYIYVTIVPIALLFTAGWLAWLPAAWRWRGLALYILALAVFDAICFWGFIIPYYY